jgi:nucleotide-binding universal stress UspA family protein
MNDQEQEPGRESNPELTIRRILIGLDTSHHSLAALRAAAALAGSLGADLHGLFVEDVKLLQLAELPVAREVQFPFARRGRLSPRRMRRQLRAQARQARQALASMCKERGIEWSFQVVRGEVSTQILNEAEKADLLCVGRASRPLVQRSGLGSTAFAAAGAVSRSVLLVSRGTEIDSPVVVFYDGSTEMRPSLLLASELADQIDGLLSVVVPASAAGSSKEVQERITTELDGEGLLVRYRELSGSGLRSIVNAIHTEGAGLLVIDRSYLPAHGLREFLADVDCPVLLVG